MQRSLIKICFLLIQFGLVSVSLNALEREPPVREDKYITKPYKLPFTRPVGFTLNLASIASMTLEGRFVLGLAQNISFVASPMYQNTIELPIFYGEKNLRFMDARRLNLGVGIRGHFYDYDSLDGWYIEGLARGGLTWIGQDSSVWSVIPSLMAGYQAVYDSGYTVSFGAGIEWEFLIAGKEGLGDNATFLKKAYFGITKVPLFFEFSIGWLLY